MKHTIKKEIMTAFVLIIVGFMLLIWISDSFLLEKYYIAQKKWALENIYQSISDACINRTLETDAFDVELRKLCSKSNINLLIIDEETSIVKTSVADDSTMSTQLFDRIFRDIISNDAEVQKKELVKAEHYSIEQAMDSRTNTEYIELWGTIDNGNMILLNTPIDSISESINITNRFLLLITVLALGISVLIAIYASGQISKPIQEITDISIKMKSLDFGAKYSGNAQNEIAILGENINELSETLEGTISQLKTANNELLRDLEKKDKDEEMRREFLSNVSHELKTPIALIQGYAEGLRDGITDDPESMSYYCDVIIDEAAKMNHMVKQLLSLNQIEFGKDTVTLERINLTELIKNYVSASDIIIKKNEIQVFFDANQALYAWGDEFRVEEVLMNYFTNAINHCEGSKLITIKVEAKDTKYRISVFNTGNPIPDDSITHIWEKFYKVDKARTRAYGGSGVGLSIVKAIMDSMNQGYGVCNKDDGVEFWFELDRA